MVGARVGQTRGGFERRRVCLAPSSSCPLCLVLACIHPCCCCWWWWWQMQTLWLPPAACSAVQGHCAPRQPFRSSSDKISGHDWREDLEFIGLVSACGICPPRGGGGGGGGE